MSHEENDKSARILRDQIETIAKLNPDQLKVFNEVQKTLFDNYFNAKKEEQQKCK